MTKLSFLDLVPVTDTGTIAQLTNGASVTGDIAIAGIGAKPWR